MMPFRIPIDLESLTCARIDPTRAELQWYIDWLEAELRTAKAARDTLPIPGTTPQKKEV